ncbi:hypothetical protein [Streptomyces megasporus]|uniref:hypothetical protein n=1 Tax=Streptomyces megasporus TaxID=44060 RepID=UPI0004E0FF2F|nr:hypothetical protein [Streptomyces megasporus]
MLRIVTPLAALPLVLLALADPPGDTGKDTGRGTGKDADENESPALPDPASAWRRVLVSADDRDGWDDRDGMYTVQVLRPDIAVDTTGVSVTAPR